MNIPFILMITLYLILAPVVDGSCPELVWEGERFELDHRLEAYKRGDKLIINYLTPTRMELDVTDVASLEAEIVRLCGLKTLNGQKYVTQQPIGQLFGISRQMVNRRKQLAQRHGLLTLLCLLTLLQGDYATEVLRAEVKQRIMELVVNNWYRSDEQIVHTLIEEGWVNKISVGSVHHAIKQMNGCNVRK